MTPTSETKRRNVGEIDSFINLLLAARDDKEINMVLEDLLLLPAEKRRDLVRKLVSDLQAKGAPADFIEAIACLLDDSIAAKAYESISQHRP